MTRSTKAKLRHLRDHEARMNNQITFTGVETNAFVKFLRDPIHIHLLGSIEQCTSLERKDDHNFQIFQYTQRELTQKQADVKKIWNIQETKKALGLKLGRRVLGYCNSRVDIFNIYHQTPITQRLLG